jgi:hypothetical protein
LVLFWFLGTALLPGSLWLYWWEVSAPWLFYFHLCFDFTLLTPFKVLHCLASSAPVHLRGFHMQ